MVTALTAFVVGVPVINPVDVSMLRPSGNPLALKLVGVFDAVIA